MSIQNLFGKDKSDKVVNAGDFESLTNDIESVKFAKAKVGQQRQFTPAVDYSKPENFVFYGQATEYYARAIEYIYNTFPYDGSLAEQADWYLDLSPIDKHVLDNEYPKSVGHISMSHGGWGTISSTTDLLLSESSTHEYIAFKGGPNSDPSASSVASSFPADGKANVYKVSKKRTNNLLLSGGFGNTVEFFFRRDASTNSNGREIFFDIDNGEASGSTAYGRLAASYVVRANENSIKTIYTSGSYTTDVSFGVDADFTAIDELNDGGWHHYALRYYNSGSDNFECELFVDSVSQGTVISDSGSVGSITGSMRGQIGALRTGWPGVPDSALGWGKLSGSVDEFRFWKVKRTARDIGRNWLVNVGGGSNTDDANTDLGIYYKFNEGVFGSGSVTDSRDTVILDYSGRISNGNWVGYAVNGRATSSAIDEYAADNLRTTEYAASESAQPIIYAANPLVAAYKTAKEVVAYDYDLKNNASLINSIPNYIVSEDDETEGNLRSIMQIMASYLDNLHLMIKYTPKLHEQTLYSGSVKPNTFMNRVVSSWGLVSPELFVESEVLEAIASRSEKKIFEEEISNIKNAVYQNIYHALANIYKKKGTLDSFRNILRCFGIDEEIVKINLYSNNAEYTLDSKHVPYERNEKYLDFHNADRHIGSVYQNVHSTSPAGAQAHIPGMSASATMMSGGAFTLETSVLFPKEQNPGNAAFLQIPFTTSSIAGTYGLTDDVDEYTRPGSPDSAMLRLYSVRVGSNSKDAYFVLTGSAVGEITSSVYKDVYDGTQWHFAASIYPERYENNPLLSGSVLDSATTGHILYFSGSKTVGDYAEETFATSSSIAFALGANFMSASKRVFAGSDHENFTGSTTLMRSDCRLHSVAAWYDKLSDEELKWHSQDPGNYGRLRPRENFAPGHALSVQIPKADTLALLWTFDNVTGSGKSALGGGASDAKFTVDDVSSGSVRLSPERYGPLSNSLGQLYPGLGDFYLADDSGSVSIEYPTSVRLLKPGAQLSSDMVAVGDQDLVYELETKPTTYYFAAEKSLSNTISEKVVTMFAGIADFNNMIGEPVNRYRPEYKSLAKMRQMFFERINDVASTERYVEYYKWVDSAIGTVLAQLVPASADFSEGLRTVIESHALERNKYPFKLAKMRFADKEKIIGSAFGINELKFKWSPSTLVEESAALAALREAALLKAAVPVEHLVYNKDTKGTYKHNARGRKSLPIAYDQAVTKMSGAGASSSLGMGSLKKTEDQAQLEGRQTFGNVSQSYAANAANRLTTIASDNLGNYTHPYEVVQLGSRKANNKWFVEQNGVTFDNNTAYYISGAIDGTRRIRKAHKSTIVERFSAPGGPEIMGEAFLDAESSEMSPYNALPWRNLTVRRPFALWLNSHVEQFGFSSLSSSAPAWHKTNRNPHYRVEDATNEVCTVDYDTWHVTRAIPRGDRGYAWITASVLSASTNCLPFVGFFPERNEEWQGDSVGFIEKDVFISGGADDVGGDYWGSNSRIIPTVDVDTNAVTAVTGNDAGIHASVADADLLRFYLNSRTGPWQYASWNQLRAGQTDVARKHKKNNIVSVIDVNQKVYASGSNTISKGLRANSFKNYREPVFTMAHPNELHMIFANQKTSLIYPFAVERDFFANKAINDRLNLAFDLGTHEDIISLYQSVNFEKLFTFRHTQTVFPKAANTGLSRTRDKVSYTEAVGVGINGYDRGPNIRRKLWDTTAQLRGRSDTAGSNSVGKPDSRNSVWPLDAPDTGAPSAARGIGGELSNYYEQGSNGFSYKEFFAQDTGSATASILYAHRSFAVLQTAGPGNDCRPGSVCDFGLPPWLTNIEAGKNPWYISYDEFAKDVRPHAQAMSTIPEFRISDHMQYYIDSASGNFRATNRSYLRLDGTATSASAATHSATPDETFFKQHAHSDHMVHYQKLDREHANVAPLSRISLKCKGIKKLLPYNGFYPAHRTVQLAELFSQSYAPNIYGVTSASDPGLAEQWRLQSLLQPWFAPGILYNSIKAGIAVDWAAYTSSVSETTSSATTDRCDLFGVLTSSAHFRLPFESLLGLEGHVTKYSSSKADGITGTDAPDSAKILMVGPSHFNDNENFNDTRTPYFIWDGKASSARYSMAMHNFLAEVPKFFLAGDGLTSITSKEEAKFEPFVANQTYYMDIALERTPGFQMIKDPRANPEDDAVTGSCTNLDTELMTYHGRYFGPALSASLKWPLSTDPAKAAAYAYADPATAQYAPPYIVGKSVTRVSFIPTESKKFTVAEILSALNFEEKNDVMRHRLAKVGRISQTDAEAQPSFIGRMPLSASIKLDARGRNGVVRFDEAGTPIDVQDPESTFKDFWAIYPRFETPMLDFSHIQPSSCNRGPYGMWTNYGRVAPRNKGVMLTVAEPESTFMTGSNRSLLKACGFQATSKKLGVTADEKDVFESVVAVPFLDDKSDDPNSAKTVQVGARHFFAIERRMFDKQAKSAMANKPAVRAGEFGASDDIESTSISKMALAMKKYVVPPSFDFLTYSDIPPFAMYFLEFSTTLKQQDLTDIWQGVMPGPAVTAELDEVEFAHGLDEFEFFGGKPPSDNIRWLVFKVKQRAEKNYYAVTEDAFDDARFRFDFKSGDSVPEYSYNWPYDFFSLVEEAKIDVSFDWGSGEDEEHIETTTQKGKF